MDDKRWLTHSIYQLFYPVVIAYLNKLNVHNVDKIVSNVKCCVKAQQSTKDANSSSRCWTLLSVVRVKNGEKDRGYCDQCGREKDETEPVDYMSCQHPVALGLRIVFGSRVFLDIELNVSLQNIANVYQYWVGRG